MADTLQSLDYSILQQCMHCGLCLPSCPTYVESGRERSSPRGRIALLRAIADGELGTTETVAEEMSYCLGCLACTSACPAGVDYARIFETARAHVESSGIVATPGRSLLRRLMLRGLFTRPHLLRLVGRLLWFWQASGLQGFTRRTGLTRLLPRRLRELEPMAPRMRRHFSPALIRESESARGEPRYRVAVLTGCMQDLMYSEINRATVDVLRENGCDVFTPPVQPCCGSLHAHNGDTQTARELARRMLDLIDPGEVDAIISNAGGCGSHLRHYDHLLANDPRYVERAREWSCKLRDVSEWLVEIGVRAPREVETAPIVVTYHDSCHLSHGQRVKSQPRELLRAIPGLELRETVEADWCCGSAGIYNLTQPSTAAWLQDRKMGHLRATQAQVITAANPGCLLQIQNGLMMEEQTSIRVTHPVVLLAEAYAAEREGSGDQTRRGDNRAVI